MGVAAGYTWNFKIYTGQDQIARLASTKIDLLGKGYTIFLDNWFSSPELYLKLHDQKTNAVGTVIQNRQGMPKDLCSLKLERGDVVHCSSDKGLLTLVWRDKKDVCMLSTMHTAEMADTGKRNRDGIVLEKPKCVLDYNEGMKGVDIADQLALSHCSVRKSIKWHKNLSFSLLDVAPVNSYLVYKEIGGTDSFLTLRHMLVSEISELHSPNLPVY